MSKRTIKNLIVGVDLSNYSKVVAREAKELSEKLKIPATFVYVFQDIAIFDEAFKFKKPELSKHYEKEFRRKYSLSKNDNVIVRYGRPYEEIIATAKNFEDPMIIAGHRGYNSFVRFFLGSTVERLALVSPFPVWIHRGKAVVVPKKILIPCDLSARSHHTISEIGPLKSALKASTEFFYVMPEPMPVLDYQTYSIIHEQLMKIETRKVRSFRKKHPGLKTVKALSGAVYKIQERAKNFDLIALSPKNHKKSVPFFGSVTTKLLRSGDKPILVIP